MVYFSLAKFLVMNNLFLLVLYPFISPTQSRFSVFFFRLWKRHRKLRKQNLCGISSLSLIIDFLFELNKRYRIRILFHFSKEKLEHYVHLMTIT